MKAHILSLAAITLLAATPSSLSAADEGFNIFSEVKFSGELRPRYQFTDAETSTKDAGNQVTNRTNLNFTAKLLEIDGLSGTMELNAVNDFGTEQSSDAQVGGEATVAKISQANIAYSAAGATGIVGRKTVNIDNQRFVGSVGWKQNFQTLDLAAVAYGVGDFNLLVAYVYAVNAIGDDGHDYGVNTSYVGTTSSGRTNSAVVNASYKIADPIKVTAYAYLLGSYSDTYGVAATGNVAVTDTVKLDYRAEVAMQTQATLETVDGVSGDTSLFGDAMYANLDVGANISGFLAGINYEYLGGADLGDADTSQFQTPLATKHKFNGWADQFLSTPTTGLADFNLRGGYASKPVGKVLAVYHMYNSVEDGLTSKAGDAYGSEIDLLYTRSVPGVNGLNALVKGAYFMNDDAINGATSYNGNKTLAWLQLDYKF
ncbi:hypothetical protein [Sulfurimonas sp. HSL3-7]|uniref:hypothetical protein n=1 Tax=Sulfonitrofixus jiaomeiensis TaxID=3131938 RepID=UPI0031F96F1E